MRFDSWVTAWRFEIRQKTGRFARKKAIYNKRKVFASLSPLAESVQRAIMIVSLCGVFRENLLRKGSHTLQTFFKKVLSFLNIVLLKDMALYKFVCVVFFVTFCIFRK